jgi:acyl-CoA synthetase (AMP-forming)/AMP-acid ligase II
VDDCLVFGVPSGNADRVDQIVACISSSRVGVKDELKQFLLQKLPDWQVPREWWFVDSLKHNGHGRLSRAECRKSFLDYRSREVFKKAV